MQRIDVKKPRALMHDQHLIPRVKQYLEENVHQTYVDVGLMAKTLQDRYMEYNRRKSQPFRQMVEQAYRTVLRSYGLDDDDDNDDGSEIEFMEDRPQTTTTTGNQLNNMLTNMYSAPVNKDATASKAPSMGNAGIAIDISSDESDAEDDEKSGTKPTSSNAPTSNQLVITRIPSKKGQTTSTATTTTAASNNSAGNLNTFPQLLKKRKIDENDVDLTKTINEFRDKSKLARIADDNQSTRSSPFTTVPANKPNKKFKREIIPQISTFTFEHIGGMDKTLRELCELLFHIKHPEVYKHIGLPPPRGFLLHGPPGSGKTLLAQAIAGQLNVGLINVVATELIGGVSGESEERIRELFEQAAALAPCVLFIDEIDSISANRLNAQKDMERRIVAQLLSSLDGLSTWENGDRVLIIGATNRPDSLDPALRRVGRFDQEICLGIPDRQARSDILKVICKKLQLEQPFDFDRVATLTPGYVGADLLALATRAASVAVKRAFTLKRNRSFKPLEIMSTDSYEPSPKQNGTDAENHEADTIDITDDKQEPKQQINGVEMEVTEATTESNNDIENKTDAEATTVETEPKQITVQDSEPMITDENIDKSDDNKNDTESTAAVTVEDKDTSIPEVDSSTNHDQIDNAIDANDCELIPTNKDETVIDICDEVAEDDEINVQNSEEKNNTTNNNNKNTALDLNEMMDWLNNKQPPMNEEDLDKLNITMDDFTDAIKVVQPSAKREGFITVPDVTWDDIGSLRDIRDELQLAVLAPVKYPERLIALGLQARSGVLLCGPPGCGKTLLAKAIANEAGINFISVKGPELLNMYVGESERAVRQCFQRAKNSCPCVIFFDEFDALCPKRSDSNEGNATSRVVNQLLTEMDGVEDRNGVFIMAATNRPDIVDPAVLRPGRLDKILYVGLPAYNDRIDILDALTKRKSKPILADDVDLSDLAKLTENYTGADLAGLVRQASLNALKESIQLDLSDDKLSSSSNNEASIVLKVSQRNFSDALDHINPSVSEQDKQHYEKLRIKFSVASSSNTPKCI